MKTDKLTGAASASEAFGKAMVDRGGDVRTKSEIPANMWAGGDANAAGGLLAGMEEPLYSLSDSANSGKKTLEDLVEGIGKAKEHLQGAYNAIKGTGIEIDPKTGAVTTPVVNDPDLAAENDRKAQDARDIIDEALKMANDADTTATDELNGLLGTTQSAYMEIPGKDADLQKAKDLLNLPKDQITPEKAKELNDLLKRNNNPEFNKRLMQELGPQALIEDSARYSAAGSKLAESGDTAGADTFKETQRLLGESLASASQNGGLKENDFTQKLMDQAAKPLADDPIHNGYRALAPLLEHGQYDKSFLVPIAEHMTRLDAITPGVGLQNPYNPGSLPSLDNPYVIDGNKSGTTNPLDTVMGALDRSPQAAADYFTGDNADHGQYKDANGKDLAAIKGNSANPNIDYALDHSGEASNGYSLDVNRVGNALEAATTGLPADSTATTLPTRTQDMADVAQHLTHRFGGEGGGHADLMPDGKFEDIADNMTDMAQAYMPDIHNSFLEDELGNVSEDDKHLVLPVNGVGADFTPTDSARLLQALGQHDGAIHDLLGSNETARSAMLEQNFNAHGENLDELQEALGPSAMVTEILSDAAADTIVQEAADADEATNKLIDLGASAVSETASIIPAPPIVSWAASEAIDAAAEGLHTDSSAEALYKAQVTADAINLRDEKLVNSTVDSIAGHHGVESGPYVDGNAVENKNDAARSHANDRLRHLLNEKGGN